MKCLVIVAHPDDETIWMGGLMLRHPDWAWRIIALSRGNDPDRAPKFRMAARVYGAASAISDLDDSPVLASLSEDLREIKDRISAMLDETKGPPGLLFTHGVCGEYVRHIRHEQVHCAVEEMRTANELRGDLVYFAYADTNGVPAPIPAADADASIALRADEYTAKQRVIREIYGFTEGQFETQAAGRIEAFRFGTGNVSHLKALLESGLGIGTTPATKPGGTM